MECKKCYGYGYRFWIRRSSGRSSTNLSPVAPPNSPILSVLVSVIIYSAFCDLQSLSYTHTSSSIPPLVNLAPSVSSSTSSSCRSGSPRTPIASFPPGTNIPWEVWGLQSTRWLEECITADWVSIYGLRTAESIRVPKRRDRNFQPNPVCSSLCGCYDIFLLPRFLPTLSCRNVEMWTRPVTFTNREYLHFFPPDSKVLTGLTSGVAFQCPRKLRTGFHIHWWCV